MPTFLSILQTVIVHLAIGLSIDGHTINAAIDTLLTNEYRCIKPYYIQIMHVTQTTMHSKYTKLQCVLHYM